MRLFPKRYHSPGTEPGTLASPQQAKPTPPNIHVLDYSSDALNELHNPSLEEIKSLVGRDSMTWIRIEGRPTAEWMLEFGQALELHPLAQEDILNGGQRPKVEPYDGQLFLVLNQLDMQDKGPVTAHQLYLFWHPRFVVSFHERRDDTFELLIKRLRKGGTRVRREKLDYLVYSIIDLAIDHAFPVLETLGQEIEELEDRVLRDPDQAAVEHIHTLKRQMVLIRRAVWPHRDLLNELLRDDEDWFSAGVRLYLRDCYDHTIQIMDLLESYRDMTAALLDVYLSSASMRMNEIMRVLTVIATIFIPLTFLAGVYGMNFNIADSPWAMPELHWRYGYPLAWLLFIGIGVGLLVWFRRKGWL